MVRFLAAAVLRRVLADGAPVVMLADGDDKVVVRTDFWLSWVGDIVMGRLRLTRNRKGDTARCVPLLLLLLWLLLVVDESVTYNGWCSIGGNVTVDDPSFASPRLARAAAARSRNYDTPHSI